MKEIIIAGHVDLNGENNGGIAVYNQSLYTELKKENRNVQVFGWSKTRNNIADFTPIVVSDTLLGRKFIARLFLKMPFKRLEKSATIIVDRPDRVLPFYYKQNKIVCVLHGSHAKNIRIKQGRFLGRIYDFAEKIALKRADRIVSVSAENLAFYRQKYPFITSKSLVIPVGVDAAFRPLDKKACREKQGFSVHDRIFLYVGRLEKEKQVDLIIKAFTHTTAKLIIAGGGREEAALKQLAEQQKNIVFLGMINHASLPEIMNCADALVLFSKHEGLPTVILEAMACGIPVVTNGVGDIPAVVQHGRNGYLMKTLDVENLDLNLGANCIETAKEFKWNHVVQKLMREC